MNILTFNDVNFQPVKQNNQLYLTASELSKALGYAEADSVTKIYNRKADEFTPNMTQVIEITETVNLTAPKNTQNLVKKVRIFSLRGCHLIAMFARTAVAKEFRKWVLDILDKAVGEPVPVRYTISVEQQQAIRNAVAKVCKDNRTHYQTVYEALKKEFDIPRYNELLAVDFERAMAFIADFELPSAEIAQKPFDIYEYLNAKSNQIMDYVHDLERAVFELTGNYPKRPYKSDEIAKGVIGHCLNGQRVELSFEANCHHTNLRFSLVDSTALRIHDSNIAKHIELGNVNKKYLDDIIQASVKRLNK